MNRYFDASSQSSSAKHKVVVFPRGRSPGRSYWSDKKILSCVRWSFTDMKYFGNPEITRANARKLVKHIP